LVEVHHALYVEILVGRRHLFADRDVDWLRSVLGFMANNIFIQGK